MSDATPSDATPSQGMPGQGMPGHEMLPVPGVQRPAFASTDELCEALGIGFSDEQLAAITAPLEPGVIIAGAGSGKTTVMAARVVWLVGTGQVQPHQVLGLTFTRKAANELSQRVRQALERAGVVPEEGPDDAGEEVVMTYDAFAARLVADHGLRIAVETDPTMITGAARYRLASRAVTSCEGPFEHLSRLRPASVIERVLQLDSELTAHLVDPDDIVEFTREFGVDLDQAPLYRGKRYAAIDAAEAVALERVELLTLVADYQALKRSLGLVEFADQMAVAAELVRRVPGVSASLREQFRVVLLDEYQDTSAAQAALLHGLFSGNDPARGMGHPVTAVGDPWQAIYGWRGAAASNILGFASQFRRRDGSPASRFTLSVNRRSGQEVLDVANRVAATLLDDPALTARASTTPEAATPGITTTGDEHTPIRLVAPEGTPAAHVYAGTFETWADEVEFIADRIVADHRSGRAQNWLDIAVLVRRNADVAALHAALMAREVPVEIVGLGGLLRLPEIADVVATLTLVDDVTANPALVRLLSGPRWRIGPRDLLALGVRAVELARLERPGRDELAAHEVQVPDLDADLADTLHDVDSTEVVSLLDAVDDPGEAPLSAQARERLALFAAELQRLRRHGDEPVLDLTRRVVSTLGLDVELAADSELLATDRRAQLATFIDAVATYTDVDGDDSLAGLLAWLDAELRHGVGLDQALPTEHDSVKLLTVHRAKGLEWDNVYLPSLVEGVFPSDRVTSNWVKSPAAVPAPLRGDADAIPQTEVSKAGFDEYADALKQAERRSEDRLAYVAVTRARRHLTGTGHTWRSGVARPRVPSRYLKLIVEQATVSDTVLAVAPPPAEANPNAPVTTPLPWPPVPDTDRRDRLRSAADEVDRARARFAATGSHDDPDADPLPLDLEAQVSSWDADLDALLAQAAAAEAPVVEVGLPASMSASAMMAAMADPEAYAAQRLRPMPRPATSAATLGTRFHEWVERRFQAPSALSADATGAVGEATGVRPAAAGQPLVDPPLVDTPLVDPDDWPVLELSEGLQQQALPPEPAELDEADAGPRGDRRSRDPLDRLVTSFLASDYADRTPAAVEQPFVLVLGEHLVRGRIDAVYPVAEQESSGRFDWQVVDWKTSQAPADPVQLSLYRLAWAQLMGVDPERVDAVFVHVASMRVERPERMLDQAELTSWLAQAHGVGSNRMDPGGADRRTTSRAGVPRRLQG